MKTKPTHPKTRRLAWEKRDCLIPELRMVGWDAPRHAATAGLHPHRHPGVFEICYIVKGRVEWWVSRKDGRRDIFIVEPRNAFFTRPGEEHGGIDSVMHPCELYWVQIRASTGGKESAPTRAMVRRLSGMKNRVFRGSDQMRAVFAKIVGEHCHRDEWSQTVARSLLNEMLSLACRENRAAELPGSRPGEVSAAVRESMCWMKDHLVEPFLLADVAAAIGLSLTQFQHRFRREIGYTAGDWRNRQRVAMAKMLLAQPHPSILKIAMQCGFATSQYFATVFKRIVGRSPRQYHRQIRGHRNHPS